MTAQVVNAKQVDSDLEKLLITTLEKVYPKLVIPGRVTKKYFDTQTPQKKAAQVIEEASAMREEFDSQADALSGFSDLRTDYLQLIRAFNKLIEGLNQMDGRKREPITPESWHQAVKDGMFEPRGTIIRLQNW